MFCKDFHVANPSPYLRSGFVEVDLRALGVPDALDDAALRLYRVHSLTKREETELQIDRIAGAEGGKRIMTFRCRDAREGSDDYNQAGAEFCLEEASEPSPWHGQQIPVSYLSQYFYYTPRRASEPRDGYNAAWHPERTVTGVCLHNAQLEVYFRLTPLPDDRPDISYTGSATSVHIPGAPENVLNYYGGFVVHSPARWGQLTALHFTPIPWDQHDMQRVALRDMTYELAWAQAGPLRSVCSLRSQPFSLRYAGAPIFEHAPVEISCRLYRVFAVYTDQHKPYYTEDLFVLAANGFTLGFRPYFYSCMEHVDCQHGLRRFEHIPDYFSIQQHFYPLHYLYGFAADTHVRNLVGEWGSLQWRLSYSHHIKCTHLFMKHDHPHYDPFHAVGHDCWYEQLLKPMRVMGVTPFWPAW